MKSALSQVDRVFGRFAAVAARAAGTSVAFLLGLLAVLLWAATGPYFDYSETWQLVINTSTTIVTFLMVFLIQNSQNRDGTAIQTKLDELIRSSDAEDEFMGIERLSETELTLLHEKCEAAAKRTENLLNKTKAERERRQLSTKPQDGMRYRAPASEG